MSALAVSLFVSCMSALFLIHLRRSLFQSTGDEEQLEDQSQRVLRLYERMVAVPMLGVESAWDKYTEICSMLGMEVGFQLIDW